MRYKDLKEVDKATWDGKPFYAVYIDIDELDVFLYDLDILRGTHPYEQNHLVTGLSANGSWETSFGFRWKHVYKISENLIPAEPIIKYTQRREQNGKERHPSKQDHL